MILNKLRMFLVVASFALIISLAGAMSVYAQTSGPSNPNGNTTTAYSIMHSNSTNTMNIKTDLPSYKQGDTIVITGHVSQPDSSTAVTLRIFNAHQNLISVSQLLPSSDGSFTKTVLITGPLWTDAGTFTIVAEYGKYTQTTTAFYFNGGNGISTVTQAINSTYSLQVAGQTYSIPYIIKGGTASSMNVLAQQYTLEATVNSNSDGSLTVTLPRSLIDAKSTSGTDISFIVTVNGISVTQFSETTNLTVRILSIPFHNGDTKIDIIGTQIQVGSTPTPMQDLPKTPSTPTTPSSTTPSKIPNWVKGVFSFYAQGNLSDDDLIKALQFLIQQGIIKVQN